MRLLDHVVVIVEDLHRAARSFQDLGFVVTPRSDHPFGTSNRLIVLANCYVELVTVTAPAALPDSGFARFAADCLAEGNLGPRIIVIRTHDPEADRRRLQERDIDTSQPLRFGRRARQPDGSEAPVEFVSVFPEMGSDRFSAFFCQHLTPDQVWHPSTLTHPNGATALTSVEVEDPGTETWQRLAVLAEVEPGPSLLLGETEVRLGGTGLVFSAEGETESRVGPTRVVLAP